MKTNVSKLREVLVIDDDDEYNFLTEDTFSDCDFVCQLKFILSARKALDHLAELRDFPDLILLDINMPVLDGWDFLKEYERRGYNKAHSTLIVMISSSMYEEDKEKAQGYDKVVEYIEKPLTVDEITRIRSAYFTG